MSSHHRLLRLGVVDPGTAREVNQLMDHREEIEVDIIINNMSTIPIITILIILTAIVFETVINAVIAS